MKELEELIAVLFLSRDIAHREHLRTNSYACHMALNSFYHDIIEDADSLAEAYQARTGQRLKNVPIFANKENGSIVEILEGLLQKIEELRKEVLPEDSTIQNKIDDAVSTFLSVIYKLTFLK